MFIVYALAVCSLDLNCRAGEADKRMASLKEIEKEGFLLDRANQYRMCLSPENGD